MKTIAIIDVYSASENNKSFGHYIPVAKMYQKIFKSVMNVKVAGGPIYKKYFDENALLKLPFGYIVGGSFVLNKIKIMINCYRAIRFDADFLIFQHASHFFLLLLLIFVKPKAKALYIISYNNFSEVLINKVLLHFAKYRINGIICPFKEIGEIIGIRYVVVPDYLFIRDNFKSKCLSLNEREYDICILGLISYQKGTLEVIEKFAKTKYKILLAGKCPDDELLAKIKSVIQACQNITAIFDYISDEQYYNYLACSKYCILNYRESYSQRSSGVVFDALFNNTPIIGHRSDALEFVEMKEVGYLYDDITKLNLDLFFDENKYSSLLKNISKYQADNSKNIQKLLQFVTNTK